jgi:anti-sigma B factor antagonist
VSETPLELSTARVGDAAVVSVVGEVDMATAPRLSQALELVDERVARVVIDLTQVTFLDSSALNALVRCQRQLEQRDIELRLVGPESQAVRRVFEITQLTEPLHVVATLDQALA